MGNKLSCQGVKRIRVVTALGQRDLLHSNITREILGAAFEVHGVLGTGFLESLYEEAMAYELTVRGLSFQRQVEIPITYKHVRIGKHVLDLLVEDKVIVELKATKDLADIHSTIVLSYLTATKKEVALLLNFGQPSLHYKRIVRQKSA